MQATGKPVDEAPPVRPTCGGVAKVDDLGLGSIRVKYAIATAVGPDMLHSYKGAQMKVSDPKCKSDM